MTQTTETAAARQRARAKAAAAANAAGQPPPASLAIDKPVKLSNGNGEKINNGVATAEMVTLLPVQVPTSGVAQSEAIERVGQNANEEV